MTYGQTSSGKTHTLFGGNDKQGLIPKFLKEIFLKLRELESFEDCQFKFKYSFFEIYKEKIFDMLSGENELSLNLRENSKKKIYVENLIKKKAEDYQEVMEDLERANKRRRTNETQMNLRSSRSHFIINFEIETKCLIDYDDQLKDEKLVKKNFYEVIKKSQIIFIDLAGSEKQTFNNNDIVEEGCYINKSLSVLNHVIQNLSKKKNEFVHYRDSKLTYFLKEIFKGNSHFSIIGNILPYSNYLTESFNTLNFVSIAKSIATNPHINFQTKDNSQMMQKQINSLLNKIDFLERNQNTEKNCICAHMNLDRISGILEGLRNKIEHLKKFFFDDLNLSEKLDLILRNVNAKINLRTVEDDLLKFEKYFELENFEKKSRVLGTMDEFIKNLQNYRNSIYQTPNPEKLLKYKSSFSKHNLKLKKIKSDSCDFPFSKNKKNLKYHLDYLSPSMFADKIDNFSKISTNYQQNQNINLNNSPSFQNILNKDNEFITSLNQELRKLKETKFEEEKVKFEDSSKKKDKKIQNMFKRIGNLERQLRNRNKDYLFALKELEKNKIKAPPLSDLDFNTNCIPIIGFK